MTYLISLISDHLLPSYLFIKEMEGKYDELLFITTAQMMKRGNGFRLEKALNIPEQSVRGIKVSEENLNDTLMKLESAHFAIEDRFIVNLTGGTKIMSIGCYAFFSTLASEFYYIPIGKNTIENVLTSTVIPLNYRLNVKEYLSLYGLRIEETANHTQNIGIQFEREIFNRIKKEKQLKNGFIYSGIKLFRYGSEKINDNEIDVIWTHENQLFVGECKRSLSRPMTSVADYLDQIMYKLAAISKDFGIQVNMYIFIKLNFSQKTFNEDRMKAINKRMNILGIKGLLTAKDLKKQQLEI